MPHAVMLSVFADRLRAGTVVSSFVFDPDALGLLLVWRSGRRDKRRRAAINRQDDDGLGCGAINHQHLADLLLWRCAVTAQISSSQCGAFRFAAGGLDLDQFVRSQCVIDFLRIRQPSTLVADLTSGWRVCASPSEIAFAGVSAFMLVPSKSEDGSR